MESTPTVEHHIQERGLEQNSHYELNKECYTGCFAVCPKRTERPYKTNMRNNNLRHIIAKRSDYTKWFQCIQCFHKVESKSKLEHIISIHGDQFFIKWFHCAQCPYKTVVKSNFEKHIARTHKESEYIEWYKCEECSFATKNKRSSQKHFKLIHGPEKMKWFQCKYCPYVNNRESAVEEHIVARHKKLKESQVENVATADSLDLLDELLNHSEIRRFICELDGLEKFKCHFCDFKSDWKLGVERHLNLVHRKVDHQDLGLILWCYECCRCIFKTYSLLVLTRHFCCKHSDVERTLFKELDIQKTGWQQCLQQTMNKDDYNSECEQTTSKPRLCLKCTNCHYKTNIKQNLERHIVARHTEPENINWLECQHCPYKTKQKSTLKYHISAKHMDPEYVRLHKCEKCDYKAMDRKTLKKHIVARHTNPEDINWLQCAHCPYKAKEKSHLKCHILAKHTKPENVTLYKCEKCSYTSKFRKYLQKHFLLKHDPENFNWLECNKCPFKTELKSTLNRHILTEHGNSDVHIEVLLLLP